MPDDVAAVIERAMARDPSDRPASAAEFGEELRDVQRSRGVFVDEMAHPVDFGVESRKAPPSRSPHRRDTAATPSPPTPATKYRPPVSTRSPVERGRLIDIVRTAGRRRLILIHAPSGYGKTTLAAQWRDELTRNDIAVGWLTVDDDDNNAVWFLAHLLESIRRVRPALAASLGQVLEEHGDDAGRYVLTSLIDEIHEKDDPITLVVDDWHRVSDSQTIAALGFVLEHGCHHLQIIVTSWSGAGLPISRLRLQDELIEIDSEALRFDGTEARSLLNDVGGLSLPGGDVDALTASTDGWAAGLQLAALSLRGGSDTNTLLSQLSGASDVVGQFLAENVLDTLEPETAEFVLATSITERTCPGLASAVAQVTRGQAMLEDVADARPVPATDRQRSQLVSLSRHVRRIPASPTRAGPSGSGGAAPPDRFGVVRRTRLPQRSRQSCPCGRRSCTRRRPRRARRDEPARAVEDDDPARDCQEIASAPVGFAGTPSTRDRLGEYSAATRGARRRRAESLRGSARQHRTRDAGGSASRSRCAARGR